MRGRDVTQSSWLSSRPIDQWIRKDHPIRKLRVLVDFCLREMDAKFERMYDAHYGRMSIPPEQLMRALLLQRLFTIRSERLLMEHLDYNLLYRWFVGLEIDQTVWNHSTFSANRERMLKHDVMRDFFDLVLDIAKCQDLVSIEHFSVDGTQIQAYGAMKRFVPKVLSATHAETGALGDAASAATVPEISVLDAVSSSDQRPAAEEPAKVATKPSRNPDVDFKGEIRSNATHFCETDPDALSYRKGDCHPAVLSVLGHALMENRYGLIVDAVLTQATGTAECEAALLMAGRTMAPQQADPTLGADKAYDTKAYVEALKDLGVTAHSAQNKSGRRSNICDDLPQTDGYKQSLRRRKRVEEFFGWAKCIGMMRKSAFVGVQRTGMAYMLVAAGYNLVRIMNIIGKHMKLHPGELRPA